MYNFKHIDRRRQAVEKKFTFYNINTPDSPEYIAREREGDLTGCFVRLRAQSASQGVQSFLLTTTASYTDEKILLNIVAKLVYMDRHDM